MGFTPDQSCDFGANIDHIQKSIWNVLAVIFRFKWGEAFGNSVYVDLSLFRQPYRDYCQLDLLAEPQTGVSEKVNMVFEPVVGWSKGKKSDPSHHH